MAEKKVLIIDDRAEIVELIKSILEREGYATAVLNTSVHAIDVIKKEQPGLVLVDVMMPDKDGYQVCDEIRCSDDIKHIPVIVVTGKALEKDLIDQAYETYGACDFLTKPFEPADLIAKVKKHILK